MHVPVHAAEEGGQGDGRPDQRGPRPHALPEGMSTGRTQNMTRRFMIAAEHFEYIMGCIILLGHRILLIACLMRFP